MKSRLSITIDAHYAHALQRISREENRSLSNQIEQALAEWLARRPAASVIPSTPGRFVGNFSREDTYADD
jgi:hypothetical protein